MEPKRHLAEQAAAIVNQLSANNTAAISGGACETPATPPVATNAVSPTIFDSEFAATVVAAYESIVQSTSDFIERVLGPYDSEP